MNSFKYISDKPSIAWINNNLLSQRIDSSFYSPKYVINEEKLKNSGLSLSNLEHITAWVKKGIFDMPARLYSNERENHIPFIRISNIKDLEFDTTDLVYIPINSHKKEIKTELVKGDIVISKVGTIGNIGIINEELSPCNFSQNNIGIKMNGKIDSHYLAVYMLSKYCILQLNRHSTIQVQAKLNLSDIRDLIVPIPSPEIQKYIGDKVRRAEELREEAITLQKDIDILLDVDMLLEETDRINNIFHSKVNWTNEINIVDRIDPNFYQKKYRTTIEKLGDNKVELGELVKISKRRYQTGDINKYIEISSINNSFGTIDEVEELRPEEIPTSAKHQVKEGDILVSLVRPTRKAISIVTKEYDNAICTGGFAVLQSKGKVPVEFLTAVLRTNFAGIQFERYCTGSTYPTINENDVVKIFIPQYSEKQINKITEKYRRIIESIYRSKQLIQEAKQDVEDLIEGDFEMSELNNNSSTESRC
jgi:type I restriction enzyme S subunit